MRIYFEVYGCWLNKADAMILRKIARDYGFEEVSSPGEADIITIVTCAVRGDTERKMLRRIAELNKYKNKRLVVFGCLTPIRGATIRRLAPKSSILGPNAFEEFSIVLKGKKVISVNPFRERTFFEIPPYNPETFGMTYIVPIAVGCLGKCNFCIAPYMRRRLTSYPEDIIVSRVREAVEKGARLIILTAQDVAAYGRDRNTNLVHLLDRILEEVEGEYFLRLGMMEPSLVKDMLEDLAERFKDDRILKYIHLPLQSGSNKVLKLMNRRYTVEEFNEIIERFRKSSPHMTLVTDVIVGYPGESEEDFEKTVEEILRIKPDKVHVARYTLRPYTRAYLEKQVREPVKKMRSRLISKLSMKISFENNKRLVGKEFRGLVLDPRRRRGRLLNFKPVILQGNLLDSKKIVRLRIVEASPLDLKGVVV